MSGRNETLAERSIHAVVKAISSIGARWQLVKRGAQTRLDDYEPNTGYVLAYRTVSSVAPLLLIMIGILIVTAIMGLVITAEPTRGGIFGQLHGLMSDDVMKGIELLLASLSKLSEGVTATVIGVGLPTDDRQHHELGGARSSPHTHQP